jgi:nitroimidazol reductase NimA-like FMN-containing flavoprotein (pyridoxamine 5'-phosphate oxidase superfamily)
LELEETMRSLRRKEKAITDENEMSAVLENTKYVTVAMCRNNEPYLVTLSHGYDKEKKCIYFHCAQEGKKIDILGENGKVWGQALIDKGYVKGKCDHLFATTQFMGSITFVDNIEEKRHGLQIMIKALEEEPEKVVEAQLTKKALQGVNVGRIDIKYMSGKKSEKVIVSL